MRSGLFVGVFCCFTFLFAWKAHKGATAQSQLPLLDWKSWPIAGHTNLIYFEAGSIPDFYVNNMHRYAEAKYGIKIVYTHMLDVNDSTHNYFEMQNKTTMDLLKIKFPGNGDSSIVYEDMKKYLKRMKGLYAAMDKDFELSKLMSRAWNQDAEVIFDFKFNNDNKEETNIIDVLEFNKITKSLKLLLRYDHASRKLKD